MVERNRGIEDREADANAEDVNQQIVPRRRENFGKKTVCKKDDSSVVCCNLLEKFGYKFF